MAGRRARPIVALLALLWTGVAHAESSEQTFSNEFVRLLRQGTGDPQPLIDLVDKFEAAVYPVVVQWAGAGLDQRARGTGDTGTAYLTIAQLMAQTYAARTGRGALAATLGRYVAYDQAAAQERRRADGLLGAGVALGDARAREALAQLVAADGVYSRLGDDIGAARARTGIAKLHFALDDMAESSAHGTRALSMAQAQGSWLLVAENLTNLGLVHQRRGDYGRALTLLEGAVQAHQSRQDALGEGEARLNLGGVYPSIGRLDESARELRTARDGLARVNAEESAAKATMNLGVVEFRRGNMVEALNAYQAALTTFTKLGLAGQEASVLLNLAVVYGLLGSPARAHDSNARARDIFKRLGDLDGEVRTLVNLGRSALALGRTGEATVTFREAAQRAEKANNIEAQLRAYWGLGAALRRANRLEDAGLAYSRAIDLIERLQRGSQGLDDDTRTALAAEKRGIFREFIDVLLTLHTGAPGRGWDQLAFTTSERAKSRVFQEMVGKAAAVSAFGTDPTFRQAVSTERSLAAHVTALRQRMAASVPLEGASTPAAGGDLAAAEQRLRVHQLDMDQRYPRYADLRRPRPVTVEEAQAALRADQALISYAMGETDVAAFVIRRGGFRLVKLGMDRAEIERRVGRLRQALDVADVASLEAFDPAEAHALYRALFEPLVPELGGAVRLYVSADGVLYTLPFEALVDRAVDAAEFAEARRRSRAQGVAAGEYAVLHYLVDTYTITYVPAVSLLRSITTLSKPRPASWRTPLVAFADPIFEPGEAPAVAERRAVNRRTASTARLLARSTGRGQLARLKESGDEALALARELKAAPNNVYLRERATEANVYRADLAGARYVLFATHGLLGGDFDGVAEPALALTLPGNPEEHDGFLSASEVLGLDLNADMVVLSACNTAGPTNPANRGEGFAGLTRSFMYAGARSVLVTHWSVETHATRDLMIETFRRLTASDRASALRDAKLTLKRQRSGAPPRALALAHPSFWAAFVVVGED